MTPSTAVRCPFCLAMVEPRTYHDCKPSMLELRAQRGAPAADIVSSHYRLRHQLYAAEAECNALRAELAQLKQTIDDMKGLIG